MRSLTRTLVLLLLAQQLDSSEAAQSRCMSDMSGDGNYQYECGFPFSYNGQRYTTCTTVDLQNIPWCFHTNGRTWGVCQRNDICLTGRVPTPRPTPPPTPRPSPEPTVQETPEPTRLPTTDLPTREPTQEPTVEPTAFPTEAPTTAEPTELVTNAPTNAPTASPTLSPENLFAVQLSPFSLRLLLQEQDPRRRHLQQEEDAEAGASTERTNELYEILYDFLMETYAFQFVNPAASMQLTLLDQGLQSQQQEEDFQSATNDSWVLSWQILGKILFATSSTPPPSEVDSVTHDALRSDEFLLKLQKAQDALLQQTSRVAVRLGLDDDSVREPNDTSGDNDDKSGLFIVSVTAAIVCGLGAVAIFAYVLVFNQKKKKQKQTNGNKSETAAAVPPGTPQTDAAANDDEFFVADARLGETTGDFSAGLPLNTNSSEVDSVYSYRSKTDEGSGSIANGSIGVGSEFSYGYPKTEDMW